MASRSCMYSEMEYTFLLLTSNNVKFSYMLRTIPYNALFLCHKTDQLQTSIHLNSWTTNAYTEIGSFTSPNKFRPLYFTSGSNWFRSSWITEQNQIYGNSWVPPPPSSLHEILEDIIPTAKRNIQKTALILSSWWEFFSSPPHPERLWGPPSLLSNVYQGLGSPPSSAAVKEWAELYLLSPTTPSWRGAQLKHRDNFTFTLKIPISYVNEPQFSATPI